MSRTRPKTSEERSEFVISRTFEAPRAQVWRAWTEADRMSQWWGPKGVTGRFVKLDLKPGGIARYFLNPPDGPKMWGKLAYREVVAPERLVFAVSFSDEKGGMTRHPMAPTWPLEMLTTITLAEQGSKTKLTVRRVPIDPTEEERPTFDGGHDSMNQGWTGTLDQLAAFLAKA